MAQRHARLLARRGESPKPRTGRAMLAASTVALATAFTLVGAPAAEALGLI